MSQNNSKIVTKINSGLLKFAGPGSARIEAEELLNEIDNLALLLHEVRKQTDRIEAAADAIGDAILSALGGEAGSLPSLPAGRRSALSMPSRPNARARTAVARATNVRDVQP
jgi:hypothetical protein